MSRIIKFRIWSAEYKKYLEDMQYPNGHSMLWLFASDGTPYHIEAGLEGLEAIPLNVKIGEVMVEQFTGLHDRNGKEIYEGDIVKQCAWNDWEKGKRAWTYGRAIVWDTENCKWTFINKDGKYDVWNVFSTSGYEVIGNIHEHPNLLQ